MQQRVKCSGAKVNFETIPNLEVNLVTPARLALEEPKNDEVEMVLYKSLPPCFIEILVQAAPEPFETYNPNDCPLTLSRFL